jgi:two-component system, sensor histidine kinase ChiS
VVICNHSRLVRLLFCLFVLCLTSLGSHVVAQYKALNFRHITTKSGLPYEYIYYSIIQDYRGFMWFGSENGLHRYDGYEFVSYFHDPDDSLSISGNAVFHITGRP